MEDSIVVTKLFNFWILNMAMLYQVVKPWPRLFLFIFYKYKIANMTKNKA